MHEIDALGRPLAALLATVGVATLVGQALRDRLRRRHARPPLDIRPAEERLAERQPPRLRLLDRKDPGR